MDNKAKKRIKVGITNIVKTGVDLALDISKGRKEVPDYIARAGISMDARIQTIDDTSFFVVDRGVYFLVKVTESL